MTEYYVVRPNLGNPLILTPSQLKSFEITVAGKSSELPDLEILYELEGLQIELRSTKTDVVEEDLPLKFQRLVMAPRLYTDVDSGLKKVDFPENSLEHQYVAGFRWECKFEVGIDVPEHWKPKGGWPAMGDIIWKARTNYHAIHVRDTLPSPNGLKFLHVTDAHVARRYDKIPEVLCQHLKPWQQKVFLAKYRNFNDHLRSVIREANRQAAEGELDFIILTGDLVDYYHDGYFKGDNYHFGYGETAPTVLSESDSNIRLFVEIITGRDGKGEALDIPIFIVPGNHDYLPYETLLALNIEFWSDLSFWDYLEYYFFTFIWLGFLIDETFRRYIADEKADRYHNPNLNKLEAVLFDMWKRGDKDQYERLARHYREHWNDEGRVLKGDEETMSLSKAFRFATPSKDYFAQYLTEINYDTDFTFPVEGSGEVGNIYFVCLNTGQDVFLPSASQLIEAKADFEKLPYRERHALEGNPHNRGLIQEHVDLLHEVKQTAWSSWHGSGQPPLVFVFSHAPIIHEDKQRVRSIKDKEHRFSGYVPESTPDGSLRWNVWEVTPFYIGLAYGIGEGLFQLVDDEYYSMRGFTVSFSGHTHDTAEYNSVKTEVYSPKPGDWPGLAPGLEVECYTKRYSETLEPSAEWLDQHRPLFFISGSLTSRQPSVREITLGDNCLLKATMNQHLPRFNQEATAGPMACFLAAAVAQFAGVAGYKASVANIKDPLTHYEDGVTCDRDVVMWDMIENFQLMYHYLKDIQHVGGFTFSGDCMSDRRDVHEYIDGWSTRVEVLLKQRNIEVPKDRQKKYNRLNTIINEIFSHLKQLSGWVAHDGQEHIPIWYEEWYKLDEAGKLRCPMSRLLLANTAVWLNRFGLWSEDGAQAINLQHQFESVVPYGYGERRSLFVDEDCPKRIVELFEFAAADDNNPLRLWYAFESTHLAELGGYELQERNELNPSVHLNWARSAPQYGIITDLIVKYRLQAEHQYKQSGLEGLKQFYSSSSARLAAWAAKGEPIVPSAYAQKCEGWSHQRIIADLGERVSQTAERLIPELEEPVWLPILLNTMMKPEEPEELEWLPILLNTMMQPEEPEELKWLPTLLNTMMS